MSATPTLDYYDFPDVDPPGVDVPLGRWAKFKRLGPEWLERAIDAAPDQSTADKGSKLAKQEGL